MKKVLSVLGSRSKYCFMDCEDMVDIWCGGEEEREDWSFKLSYNATVVVKKLD